jgi:hypothetical protein
MRTVFTLLLIGFCTTAIAQQGMGVGNNNPLEMLDVTGAIKVGTDLNNGVGAPSGGAGTIRFRSGVFEGWNGSAWVPFSGGGTITGSGAATRVAFWSGSGTLSSSSNLFWDNVNNRLGIGLSNPTHPLDVHATTGAIMGVGDMIGSNPLFYLRANGTTNVAIMSRNGHDMVFEGFSGSPLEWMRIKSNGNVGIGTTAPGAKLEVAGQVKITGGTPGLNKVLTSDANGLATWVNPATLIANDGDWTISGVNQYSAVSGNVGIGTTLPDYKLHVSGGDYLSMKLTAPNYPLLKFSSSYNSGNGAEIWQDNTGDLRININGTTNAIYGKATGDIGIGMVFPSVPAARLDVNNGTSSVPVFVGRDNGTEVFRIADGGNVGIGTTAPGAKLEVAGQVKITGGTPGSSKVLTSDAVGLASWQSLPVGSYISDADNDTKIQVEETADEDKIRFDTNGSERMLIDNSGNLGIGTTTPESLLNVVLGNNGLNTPLVIRNTNTTAGGNAVGVGFANGDVNNAPQKAMIVNERTESFGRGKLHFILNDAATSAAATLADSKMTIDRSGNVGIGTTAPVAKLDVAGTVALNDNQLRLRDGADGNHFLAYIGGAFDGAKLTGNNNVILNTMTGGDALIVTGNRVGIGTPSPIAPLHVESQSSPSYGNFTYYAFQTNAGSGSCCAGTVNGVSIHASGRVMASEFDAFSDERIKNVIGLSDTEDDLQRLLGIQITDYRMKDKAKDLKPYKKVIAQQVEEVYPQAVSTITEVIPDIYTLATAKNGFISLNANVQVGDRIKLILESGNRMVSVTRVEEYGFEVDSDINEEVFVYGREVDDFKAVDYEAISMLNVSATQELFKMIQKLKMENDDLKASVSEIENLKAEMIKLKEWTRFENQTLK